MADLSRNVTAEGLKIADFTVGTGAVRDSQVIADYSRDDVVVPTANLSHLTADYARDDIVVPTVMISHITVDYFTRDVHLCHGGGAITILGDPDVGEVFDVTEREIDTRAWLSIGFDA